MQFLYSEDKVTPHFVTVVRESSPQRERERETESGRVDKSETSWEK
jgi:hypothetical protein